MENLIESLRSAPVVPLDDYHYFVHPVTDCLPIVEPELMREITDKIQSLVDMETIDKILTAESMGIHHATALSLASDVPFVVARKRQYGFDDEVSVHQTTGYDEGELYVNFIEPGDRLLLLDDVLATGGTLRALYDAVSDIGAIPVDAIVIIRRETGERHPIPIEVKRLVDVDVVDGSVIVNERG